MSTVTHSTTVLHPRADEVDVTDQRPREIVLTVSEGVDVELWPGADDHDAQLAWLDRVEAAVRTARSLMLQARRDQRPDAT